MFVMIAKERIRCPGLQAMRSGKLADAQLPAHEVHAASNRKHPFSASLAPDSIGDSEQANST